MNLSLIVLTVVCSGCSAVPASFDSASRRLAAVPEVRATDDGAALFAGATELGPSRLAELALARNPSLERARQGWRAALAVVESSSSLADPVLGLKAAPLSFVSDDTRLGVGLEVSQELPWPGKRRLRAQIALAESDAASEDVRLVRTHLALLAATLHADYAFADRALGINATHLELLAELGHTVEAYLETGKTWQEQALSVDVEVARSRRRRLALEARRAIIGAQINALLHRSTSAPLPPPAPLPDVPATPVALASAEVLAARALERRPELAAIAHRTRAAEAAIGYAKKDYWPDLRLTGTYNRMWPVIEHQFMVGVAVNLPLQRSRRAAALEGADAMLARSSASHRELAAQIALEVSTARQRIIDADAAARLYGESLVPAARDRLAATQVGLDAGRTTFIDVIDAEAELHAAQLDLASVLADVARFRAELAWAMGSTGPEDAGAMDVGAAGGAQ